MMKTMTLKDVKIALVSFDIEKDAKKHLRHGVEVYHYPKDAVQLEIKNEIRYLSSFYDYILVDDTLPPHILYDVVKSANTIFFDDNFDHLLDYIKKTKEVNNYANE